MQFTGICTKEFILWILKKKTTGKWRWTPPPRKQNWWWIFILVLWRPYTVFKKNYIVSKIIIWIRQTNSKLLMKHCCEIWSEESKREKPLISQIGSRRNLIINELVAQENKGNIYTPLNPHKKVITALQVITLFLNAEINKEAMTILRKSWKNKIPDLRRWCKHGEQSWRMVAGYE